MTYKTLDFFRVPDSDLLEPGQDLAQASVSPVQNMAILKFVGDDEGVQQKAMSYAWERLHLRGVSESEASHPMWNCWKKSLSQSNLSIDIMKLTLCNFDHGAYKSGDKLEAKRDAFELYLSDKDQSYYQAFAEKVKQKSWFGMNAALRDLLFDWTLQEEAIHALQRYIAPGQPRQPWR
ncbi:unnamed protein product [Effrenium voratum]|nr:unnamed protein product [Effrenium voratum]